MNLKRASVLRIARRLPIDSARMNTKRSSPVERSTLYFNQAKVRIGYPAQYPIVKTLMLSKYPGIQ